MDHCWRMLFCQYRLWDSMVSEWLMASSTCNHSKKKKKKRIWEMCAFFILRPTCTCPLRPGNHTTCETQHWGSQWRTTIPSSVGNSSAVHMTELFQSLTVTWTLKIAIQSFHMTFKFTKQYGCKWFVVQTLPEYGTVVGVLFLFL